MQKVVVALGRGSPVSTASAEAAARWSLRPRQDTVLVAGTVASPARCPAARPPRCCRQDPGNGRRAVREGRGWETAACARARPGDVLTLGQGQLMFVGWAF